MSRSFLISSTGELQRSGVGCEGRRIDKNKVVWHLAILVDCDEPQLLLGRGCKAPEAGRVGDEQGGAELMYGTLSWKSSIVKRVWTGGEKWVKAALVFRKKNAGRIMQSVVEVHDTATSKVFN